MKRYDLIMGSQNRVKVFDEGIIEKLNQLSMNPGNIEFLYFGKYRVEKSHYTENKKAFDRFLKRQGIEI